MKPLVSIIVPCYNQAQYLPEALDSVLAQTYQNWECVIVNDGSPDNTDEIAESYCKKDSRFVYLKQENQGVSMARNNGVRQSHGEYILPLDGDDMIAPTYCEKAIRRFEKFPETKVVYCKAEIFGDQRFEWVLPEYNYDDFIWSNCIFNSAFFRRIDFDQTLGYNRNMVKGGEDKDFWLSLIRRGDVVHRIDEILFYYRTHGYSRMTDSNQNMMIVDQQIYHNHIDIFEPYNDRLLYYFEEMNISKTRVDELMKELSRTRNTWAYRIGKKILVPFSIIRKLRKKCL